METNNQYFNPPQQRAILAFPNTGYHVWGRGTGKSEGPGAFTLSEWANNMPRSAIGIIGATYMQLLDRTLPPLFRSWERMGYRRNVHYWVRRKPPKELNIPLPYYAPDTDEHAIYWWNGAYFALVSQDRPGSANGKTFDADYGDEAKLLNKKKYDSEISKANRGNVREFGDYCGHHGSLFLTDMPTTPEAKWILEKDVHNTIDIQKGDKNYKMQELINVIINYQLHINKLYYQKIKSTSKDEIKAFNRKIYSAERTINELRRRTVYYSEASSLENIHFLGLDTIKKWKRDDLDVDFRTQVLNQRLYQVANGFYPNFDFEYHCYDSYDYNYIDSVGLYLPNGLIKDSRVDGDVDPHRPLDIGMDAGARLNCMVVGQEHPDVFKIVNCLFVKKPKLIQDVVDEFTAYYDHQHRKEVNFYYDHTFVGTDATRIYSYADAVRNNLVSKKWKVNMVNIGQQPGHDTRYRMWGSVYKEFDPRTKPVRYNRNNCAQLLIAVQCAGALQGSKGTEKDKRPEKRLDVPAEEATHLTDAMDTLYIGRFQHRLGYAPVSTEAFFG